MRLGYPARRKALVINCTPKRSPDASGAEAPAQFVTERLDERGVSVVVVRGVDLVIEPGVVGEAVREGDA
ncbi:hypothetical protein JK361_05340 [Streptomyces sp. 5-8]|uniref:NADPH-dependent FMN reductase-like domain-containing protein n=1 Tax=Streptomyces musisoli TaxID=2802280 RepID=A0ABS1NWH2_9ACTN|nr:MULTISPECIES: hypothetical protein [Streptomyces]MBL1104036.1 hypothetical protein [Streptomyces musisoli]MBY8840109.1 hypothetical protein [Streptomyces sp. SP2-10]